MNDPKQIILVRKDLNMPKGKLGAQIAHASMAPILQMLRQGILTCNNGIFQSQYMPIQEWLNRSFTKICLKVNDETELHRLHNQAKRLSIPTEIILDEGRTYFSEPTFTCCGIGPWEAETIDSITSHLKLL